jgi:hypothetical protein
MKVSEKGAVSIYGMGRFPVTLYKEQWLKLLEMSADIRAFIAANEAQFKDEGLNSSRRHRNKKMPSKFGEFALPFPSESVGPKMEVIGPDSMPQVSHSTCNRVIVATMVGRSGRLRGHHHPFRQAGKDS